MRFLLFLALICAAPIAGRADTATGPSGVAFVRVWPGWKGINDFKRISEYFTDKENTGMYKVERSRNDSRDGYYFTVRVLSKNERMPGAKFVLKVITPDSPFPRTYTFPSVIQKGKSVYELGLTGSDWPGRHAHPVAWKLQLLAPDGTELVQQISFLWNPMDA